MPSALHHLKIWSISLALGVARDGVAAHAGQAERLREFDVRNFGATADARHDNTRAFQSALDKCADAGGGTVFVPAGRYAIRGHLNVPEYVTLAGTFEAPACLSGEHGTTLLATEGKGNAAGTPFIFLNRDATLKGIAVLYPEQSPDAVAEYPWCVRGRGDNCSIINVLLVNPYQAVDFGTFPAGRHYINGLYAQALKTGLFIDKCWDIGRVENVHFWPFWTEGASRWTEANGTAFIIARTDWEYMLNCFCISYKVGYHFVERNDGPGNAVLTQCGSDVGPLAVKVDAVQPHAGVSFVNGQFMSGIDVANTNMGPVKFTACGFWGLEDRDPRLVIRGTGRTSFIGCHFSWWTHPMPCLPIIVAESGSLTVNGCEFLDEHLERDHIELKEDVEAATICENVFRTPPRIIDHSEGDVVIANNVQAGGTRLMQALETEDAAGVAANWERRLSDHGDAALTSQSAALRLASAQVLRETSQTVLREKLLKSLLAPDGNVPETFAERARDELASDGGGAGSHRTTLSVAASQTPIELDGKLDPQEWPRSGFSAFPSDSASASTSFSLQWDDEFLYIGARISEPHMDRIRCAERKHDGKIWTDDSVEIFVCPRSMTHKYLQLIVNAAGAWYDGIGNLQATNSTQWNAKPDIATTRESDAWTIEMRIRWTDIGRPPSHDTDRWSGDVRRWRYAGGSQEYTCWSGAPPSKGDNHHPEAFGFLVFKGP